MHTTLRIGMVALLALASSCSDSTCRAVESTGESAGRDVRRTAERAGNTAERVGDRLERKAHGLGAEVKAEGRVYRDGLSETHERAQRAGEEAQAAAERETAREQATESP